MVETLGSGTTGVSIGISSQAVTAELQNIINSIGAAGSLQILDGNSNIISQITLSNPAGTISSATITLTGLAGQSFAVSSIAPLGTSPTTASILSSGGTVVLSGLPISFAPISGIVLTSTADVGTITIASAQYTHGPA